MVAQGRGGAATALVAGVVLLCVLLPITGAAAMSRQAPRTYVVGDDKGWGRDLNSWWPKDKTFYAGDVLVFKYDKELHDVSVVGGKGYQRCKVPRNSAKSWVMRTGNDQVTLRRGNNYFICGLPGHCDKNMKLAVKAW